MDIKIDKQEKGTAYIKVSVPTKKIDELKSKAVQDLASQVTIKGFRQGKAPLKLSQEKIDPTKSKYKKSSMTFFKKQFSPLLKTTSSKLLVVLN